MDELKTKFTKLLEKHFTTSIQSYDIVKVTNDEHYILVHVNGIFHTYEFDFASNHLKLIQPKTNNQFDALSAFCDVLIDEYTA